MTDQELKTANQWAQEYDKSIRVIKKSGWFGRFLGNLGMVILTIVTLGIGGKGKAWKEKFMNGFLSTLGPYILVADSLQLDHFHWVLPHEARHVRQYRFFAFGLHPLLGFPGMILFYALFPIPMLGAFGRVYLEMDAERSRWKKVLSEEGDAIIPFFRISAEQFAETVAGPMYFYPMPTAFVKWYFRKNLEKTINESLQR